MRIEARELRCGDILVGHEAGEFPVSKIVHSVTLKRYELQVTIGAYVFTLQPRQILEVRRKKMPKPPSEKRPRRTFNLMDDPELAKKYLGEITEEDLEALQLRPTELRAYNILATSKRQMSAMEVAKMLWPYSKAFGTKGGAGGRAIAASRVLNRLMAMNLVSAAGNPIMWEAKKPKEKRKP